MSDCRKEILDILTEHDVYMNIPNSIIASSKADDLITDFESLLSKQRAEMGRAVEKLTSVTLPDGNIIISKNQVIALIEDTNEC